MTDGEALAIGREAQTQIKVREPRVRIDLPRRRLETTEAAPGTALRVDHLESEHSVVRRGTWRTLTIDPAISAPQSRGNVAYAKLAYQHVRWKLDEHLSSRDRLHKLHRFYPQCVRQFDDVNQTDVTFASFDSADIVSMQVRQLRQPFLGKAALRPQFANASAEEYARIRASHLKVYGAV